MEELNELLQQRRIKLDEISSQGLNPYRRFKVNQKISDLLDRFSLKSKEELEESKYEVLIAGRIMTKRGHGKVTFCNIQQGSDLIQIYVKANEIGVENYKDIFLKFDIGDFIGISGHLFRTKTDELTVWAKEVTLLTKSLRPLPEKWHGLKDVEIRYRQRYVDMIVNPDVVKNFKIRTAIINKMRQFLNERDFLEVETPMLQSIPGGATAKPFCTHHNALNMDLFLRIAPELFLKRLVVGGLERVYEINRNFRNEGISTDHNPEFTMLEFYMAYTNYEDLMDLTEEMILYIMNETIKTTKVEYDGEIIDFSSPWKRISYKDALLDIGKVPLEVLSDFDLAKGFVLNLKSPVTKDDTLMKLWGKMFDALVEPKLIQPTFVIDFPVELSPLARKKENDPTLVDRFELFVSRKEIANAYNELNDPIDQKARFEEQVKMKDMGDDEAHYMDQDYIRALEHGMPPTAGEGIGIDRLTMLLTNSKSIRDVIFFPQMRNETQ